MLHLVNIGKHQRPCKQEKLRKLLSQQCTRCGWASAHLYWCLLGCDANVFLSVSCTLKRLKGTGFALSFLLRVSRCQRVRATHSMCGEGGLGWWGTGHRPAMSPAVSVRRERLRPEGHIQPLWFPSLIYFCLSAEKSAVTMSLMTSEESRAPF